MYCYAQLPQKKPPKVNAAASSIGPPADPSGGSSKNTFPASEDKKGKSYKLNQLW